MTANHSPQRGAWLDKLMVGLAALIIGVVAVPFMGFAIALFAQWLKHILRYAPSIVPAVLFLVVVLVVIAALHSLQRGAERYGLWGALSSAASFVGVAVILGGALIGRVSQDWLLATEVMAVGLFVSTIGVAGLAIVSRRARVMPRWGQVALIAGNPFLLVWWISPLNPILVLLWNTPLGPILGGTWLVVVPWVVVGFAVVFRASGRRTERPVRVR